MTLDTKTYLGEHQFTGPHLNTNQLPLASGVYIITRLTAGEHEIIDVGESHNIASRIPGHDRMGQWQRASGGAFYVWTLLADNMQRMSIEKAHRIVYNPVCGVR